MNVKITAIGNEGFQIATPAATILIDAFYEPYLSAGAAPGVAPEQIRQADLILVTHAHADHFDPAQVAEAAARTGAAVVGPPAVILPLSGHLPAERLVELDPPLARKPAPAESRSCILPAAAVTAFRTFHGRGHNSYLVDAGGFRFFHDGDNENTRRLRPPALGRLDALFIAPWQGSGWVEFVEALRPAHWFLMHLDERELDRHEQGAYLPELCDRVPPGLVVLRPGQSWVGP